MKVVEDVTYSVEDYLRQDETSEIKHQFYFGKLYEMPSAGFT